ncbi:hypothetical protein [Prosthecobacter sp.]|uniref:hypothetical protein n=1 Tax=Prosthecobacter sp. TaxID=1965333 RepID=UPI003782D92B
MTEEHPTPPHSTPALEHIKSLASYYDAWEFSKAPDNLTHQDQLIRRIAALIADHHIPLAHIATEAIAAAATPAHHPCTCNGLIAALGQAAHSNCDRPTAELLVAAIPHITFPHTLLAVLDALETWLNLKPPFCSADWRKIESTVQASNLAGHSQVAEKLAALKDTSVVQDSIWTDRLTAEAKIQNPRSIE